MKQIKYPVLKRPMVFKSQEGNIARFSDGSLYLMLPTGWKKI
jgi:hypothetical protein